MRHSRIVRRSLHALKDFPNNPNKHSRRQIRKIARTIKEHGFVGVIVIDEQDRILAGHARREAALAAGLEDVECCVVDHLNEAQKRAFLLADNRLGLDATLDVDHFVAIADEILELDADFDMALTGFDAPELDQLAASLEPSDPIASPRDEAVPEAGNGHAVAHPGDLLQLGRHRLICGDCREADAHGRLLGSERAELVVSDAPYNVKIDGHVGGSGRIKHREFAMGGGEMSPRQFTKFLSASVANLVAHSVDGSIHFHFMDWRHIAEMLDAGKAYSELKNLVVWDKGTGGMGTFYRSRHELIFVFKNGSAPHVNNFELGQSGRYRTNVWTYRGLNTGGTDRREELAMHPTVKPVQMIADAMLDCSRRGAIVLDPFGGSGSTLIAAEKTGRRARLIELDPLYVDVIVRRWQKYAKDDAVFVDTGETFDERERRLRKDGANRVLVRPGSKPTSRIVNFSMAEKS